MGWEWHHGERLTYLTIPKWQVEGIDLGFSTREGGVSLIPYDSLNLGLHVGDNPKSVLENRQRWLEEWNVTWTDTVVGEQVHGREVRWVQAEDGGRGMQVLATALPEVDGLMTQSGLGLMAFFADCVPLFFYHTKIQAVSVAHAGWKGTVHKIAQNVLKHFEDAGGRPEDVWAAIGPSIGPCCYQVDETVAASFHTNFKETPFLRPQEKGHYLLDLWDANRSVLLENGVRPENIEVAALCTACHPEHFFSHRRDGARTGRMAGWIRRQSD